MNALAFRVLAGTLRLSVSSAARRFRAALARPREAQAETLGRIVSQLARTEYGREHGLREGDGYAEFSAKLPVIGYEQLLPWVRRQMKDGGGVLTAERVLSFERAPGEALPRHFPYTSSLRRSFNRMFLLWLHDLLSYGPGLRTGKTFLAGHLAPADIADDGDPVEGRLGRLLGRFFLPPPGLARLRDPEDYKRAVCLSLLAEPRLEILLLGDAGAFLELLNYILEHRSTLAADLEERMPGSSYERADLLQDEEPPRLWRKLWPDLRLISCRVDRSPHSPAELLRKLFPEAAFQPRSLSSVEAPVAFPMAGARGCVPLLTEVFLEFEAEDGGIRLLHELKTGAEYSVLVSQQGGLARYRLEDRVKVTRLFRGTPCLDPVSRESAPAPWPAESSEGMEPVA